MSGGFCIVSDTLVSQEKLITSSNQYIIYNFHVAIEGCESRSEATVNNCYINKKLISRREAARAPCR